MVENEGPGAPVSPCSLVHLMGFAMPMFGLPVTQDIISFRIFDPAGDALKSAWKLTGKPVWNRRDAHENLLLSATLPEAWSAMSSLRRLNVAWSGIQGVLPESWAALQDLEVLNLRGNKIAGTLPASWTEMPELVHLSLDYNAFTGGLPYAWGFFPASVSLLGLSNNKRLSGTLPESWQHLYVSQIFLDNCSLTGEIPQSWLGMVQLEELSVQNNNLSGTIGVESADRWRNVELDIRQNTIHVTISEEDTPPGWKVFPQTLSNALVYSKPTTVATSWNDTQVDATVQEAFVSDAQTPPMTGDGHVPINKVPESQQAQLSKISTASIAASVGVSIIALASIVMCIKYTGPRRFFRGIWNGQGNYACLSAYSTNYARAHPELGILRLPIVRELAIPAASQISPFCL